MEPAIDTFCYRFHPPVSCLVCCFMTDFGYHGILIKEDLS